MIVNIHLKRLLNSKFYGVFLIPIYHIVVMRNFINIYFKFIISNRIWFKIKPNLIIGTT
jgi:hypothetical protein